MFINKDKKQKQTKWGINKYVDSFGCLEAEILNKIKERGNERLIKLIEKEDKRTGYTSLRLKQLKELLKKSDVILKKQD